MLASYLLSLREGIEAALIIGIVLGALHQTQRANLSSAVWLGSLTAGALSILAAVLLTRFGLELKDPGEAIFEGFTMLLAAGLLTWMIFWMSQQARHMKSNIEADVQRASQDGYRALFFLAFLSVMREGLELALFLTASVFASGAQQVIIGSFLGLGTAILLGWSIFATTVRLDLRRFFQVTGFLLIIFAGGLVVHGVHEFTEVGWIHPIVEHIWDLSATVSEESALGQLLAALFGYNPAPSLSEMIAYAAYFVAIGLGLKLSAPGSKKEAQAEA